MKKRYLKEDQKKYINGLKRYESKGIPVYIDGEQPKDSDWEKYFRYGRTVFFTCAIM